jgi:tetratricopeptide (TPR) repeat protein
VTLGTKSRQALAGVAIALCGALAYLPAYGAGFVFDDHDLVEGSRLVRGALSDLWLGKAGPDYWPLSYTALWVEWRLFGAHPAGYHLVAIALHVGAALLLWRVLRKLGLPLAWVAGLLFALHPAAVESVAWISELKNTLSAVLWLATLLVWGGDDERSPGRRAAALGLFAAALLAKVSVAPLPLVMLGIAVARHGRMRRRDVVEVLPFVFAALAASAVNIAFQHQHAMVGWAPERSLAERVGGAGWAFGTYLVTAYLPARLAILYPPWPLGPGSLLFWAPLAALCAASALLWRGRRAPWPRAALLALGYHLACVAPVLGLVEAAFFRLAPVANHLQYLALMGPAAFAAWALSRAAARWPPALAATAALVLALGAFTAHRAAAYRDDLELWEAAAREAPRSPFARQALGLELVARGEAARGRAELAAAVAISTDPAFRHEGLSTIHLLEGRTAEAAAEARLALAARPSPGLASDAAWTLLEAGHAEEAIAALAELARRAPDASEYAYRLGSALVRAGRPAEAAEALRAYCARNPGNPRMEAALTLLLVRLGRADEARIRAADMLGVPASDPRAEQLARRWYDEATGGAEPTGR